MTRSFKKNLFVFILSIHCFSGPIYIKINSSCLRDKLVDLPEQDQVRRINIFQELILKRFV
jgi:hypothetical protein